MAYRAKYEVVCFMMDNINHIEVMRDVVTILFLLPGRGIISCDRAYYELHSNLKSKKKAHKSPVLIFLLIIYEPRYSLLLNYVSSYFYPVYLVRCTGFPPYFFHKTIKGNRKGNKSNKNYKFLKVWKPLILLALNRGNRI